MTFFRELGAYEYDNVAASPRETGKPPIPMTWVDVNKGSPEEPQVRCRLCVAETPQTFSATPPYEALRFLISMCMTPTCPVERDHQKTLGALRKGSVGFFAVACMGRAIRDVSSNFLLEVMVDRLGFIAGLWSPCIYCHTGLNLQAYIYGDKFVIKGTRDGVLGFHDRLQEHVWAKFEGLLGPNRAVGDVPEVRCLNRIFRWIPGGSGRPDAIEIEADPRHADILIHQAALLPSSKAVVTPGVKQTSFDEGEPLSTVDATREVCREGGSQVYEYTSTRGLELVKRIARYLLGATCLAQRMERQSLQKHCLGLSDSDYAGCKLTRKSTTCSVFLHGSHMIKAEWYGLTCTGAAVLGMVNMVADLGRSLHDRLAGDATAAAGIAARRGVGKIRHLDVSSLWLQSQ
eukprot:6491191-Amphidinium_carterae.1